jgi:Uma2 family endonuclease
MSLEQLNLPRRPSRRGEPAWEVVEHLPFQGEWSEKLYLSLPHRDRLVEYDDGTLELLPIPTWLHNEVALLLCLLLRSLVVDGGTGRTAMPPLNMQNVGRKYRYPAVMYLRPAHLNRFRNDFWDFADLCIEVVSPDDPDRDYVKKRVEYARAGVPEYWIDNVEKRSIVVLAQDGDAYREAGVYPAGQKAASVTLPGLEADIGALLKQAGV